MQDYNENSTNKWALPQDEDESFEAYLGEDLDYEALSANEMLERILAKTGKEGTADVTIGMFLHKYHVKENKLEELGTASYIPRDLNISSIFENLMVEITFENSFDVMFNKANELLSKYRDEIDVASKNSVNNELPEVPIFSMVIMPNKDQGKVAMKAEFPMFWSTNSASVLEPPKMLRMLFKNEDVDFIGSNDFSMLDVDTEVAIELSKRRNGESEYDARKRKRAELSAALSEEGGYTDIP